MIDSSAPPQLALMVANTFDEFCASTPYKELLQCRYKEANIPADTQLYLTEYPDLLNWVLVVEEDVPDTLVLTPVIKRMAEHAPRSSLYILRAEDDLSLVDSALDEVDLGEDDLLDLEMPLLLFFNEEWQHLGQWGPRPRAAEGFLDRWLEQNSEFETLALSEDVADQDAHTILLDKLTYEMRVWYVSELDHECCKEIHGMLETIVVELDDEVPENGDDFSEHEEPPVDLNGATDAPTASHEQRANNGDASDAAGDNNADESSADESDTNKKPTIETEASAESEVEPTKPSTGRKPSDRRSGKRTNDRRRGNSRRRRNQSDSS